MDRWIIEPAADGSLDLAMYNLDTKQSYPFIEWPVDLETLNRLANK